MDSMAVWIGTAVGLIGIAAYVFTRAVNRRGERVRKEHAPQRSSVVNSGGSLNSGSPARSKDAGPSFVSTRGSAQRCRSARCEAERQKMRPLTNYNEDVIDRLVAFERDRMPTASDEELHFAAHERLVRDNR